MAKAVDKTPVRPAVDRSAAITIRLLDTKETTHGQQFDER